MRKYIHCVPKLAAPLFQTCLIQSVVYGFQQNIVHCTILNINYGHTNYDVHTLPCLLSVTSLCRQSLFTLRYIQCIVIDKGIKLQRTRLRQRVSVEAKSGHFEHKL